MTENNATQTGRWWHWGILAIVFLAGGIQWIIDPPVSGVGSYVLAVIMLGVAATASRKAWTQWQLRGALRGRGPDIEQMP